MTPPPTARTSGPHRQAEDALRESEARFRSLSAASPIGVFQSDNEGQITYANPRALQIFSLSEPDALGHGWLGRIHGDDVDAVVAGWGAALRAGEEYAHEYRLVAPDGTIRWVHCTSAPLRIDGVSAGAVGTVEDVTVRKELEAQLRQAQKMEAVGQLAGGVAHDFNNLLTVIIANAGLALETIAAGHSPEDELQEILRASERAASLTRQLLAFSRKQVLQPCLLDLDQVIIGIAPMLERLIGEDIEVVTSIAPDLGIMRADPGQLEQVLVNLAVNARDAMPDGGVLSLRAENLDVRPGERSAPDRVPVGRYVLLTVADTGCGMSPEVRDRVFEPFFTTKALGKGTGLGLSTVYGIVEQSGGMIWVDTTPGHGSAFSMCFPMVAECQAAAVNEDAAGATPRGAETVLVVEDETGVRLLARKILERQGYVVIDAANGNEALALAASHRGPIELLITDMVMPDLNGRDLSKRLLAIYPALRVIYMSGYTDDEIIRRGLEANNRFVEKPFTVETLACAVRSALDDQSMPERRSAR
jgi:two-component system, cell cycle sensor histidine kinase and response regulator CckA